MPPPVPAKLTLEGSFGTQKEHYDLRQVKVRTKLTEILYIFFSYLIKYYITDF